MCRRQQARIHAAKAPADDAHFLAVLVVQFAQQLDHASLDPCARSHIAAQTPSMRVVAAAFEIATQDAGRPVAGRKARQYEYRVPVAARRELQQRPHGNTGARLPQGTDFCQQQQARRRLDTFLATYVGGGVHVGFPQTDSRRN